MVVGAGVIWMVGSGDRRQPGSIGRQRARGGGAGERDEVDSKINA